MTERPEDRGVGDSLPLSREIQIQDPEASQRVLRKVYPAEERFLRDHEARALSAAQGLPVPAVLGQSDSGDLSSLYLDLEEVGRTDLRMLVAQEGPLPLDSILRIASDAATLLIDLHERSIAHGDIKPGNLVLGPASQLFLVDFENAVFPHEGQLCRIERTGFSGGTHGYAPPEAMAGAKVSPGFDIFGLGVTLHYLLTGRVANYFEDGQLDATLLMRLRPTLPASLMRLMRAMLAPDPLLRPNAQELASELRSFAPPSAEDLEIELALLEGRSIDLDGQEELQSALDLRKHWRLRLEAILQEIPITELEQPIVERVQAAELFARAISICMLRLPLLPIARERLARAQIKLPALVDTLPLEVKREYQRMRLHEARALAQRALALADSLAPLPLEDRDAPRRLARLKGAVHGLLRHIEKEEPKQREILTRIDDALAALDLAGAKAMLRDAQNRYSGANEWTAGVRDHIQRLAWLLERLHAGRGALRRSSEILGRPEAELCPGTEGLFDRLDGLLSQEDRSDPHTNLGLMVRILSEVARGYPRTELGEAMIELRSLRIALTGRAHGLLRQMAKRLEADPIPVRILSRELAEVDGILMLSGLVDTSEVNRSSLLDQLEQLRLRIEEISDKGRRLVQGAKDQYERGRLTTALYDLERALQESMDGDAGGSAAATRDLGIQKELDRVRGLREEIQHATTRLRELARALNAMQGSALDFEPKRKLFEEQEELLLFLIDKGSRAFVERYRKQLFDLRLFRCRAFAEHGEHRYLQGNSPAEQVQIAQQVLDELAAGSAELELSEDSGPLATPIRRWTNYYEQAEEKRKEGEAARLVRYRVSRKRRILAAALLVAALITTPFLYPWPSSAAESDQSLVQSIEKDSSAETLRNLAAKAKSTALKNALESLARLKSAPPTTREDLKQAATTAIKSCPTPLRTALTPLLH